MSVSEPSPLASNLQESIEQLVAETVRRSHTSHEEETQQLRTALTSALTEIETGQAALQRAVETLRTALGDPIAIAPEAESTVEVIAETPAPAEVIAIEPTAVAETESGPHELHVIAHDVTIDTAKGLQSMLSERPEVASAVIREFASGELRLHLKLDSGIDMAVFKEWIATHGGRISTQTDAVIELRFNN